MCFSLEELSCGGEVPVIVRMKSFVKMKSKFSQCPCAGIAIESMESDLID